MTYKFGPAYHDEKLVYGAQRPGYRKECGIGKKCVEDWIAFMKGRGIHNVVCLLDKSQLKFYKDAFPLGLVDAYKEHFGKNCVLHALIPDYHLSSKRNLTRILAFLAASDKARRKVVVHCSGGSGRTGHVLAAWLVHHHKLDVSSAISAVEGACRNPCEAVQCGNALENELNELLSSCA